METNFISHPSPMNLYLYFHYSDLLHTFMQLYSFSLYLLHDLSTGLRLDGDLQYTRKEKVHTSFDSCSSFNISILWMPLILALSITACSFGPCETNFGSRLMESQQMGLRSIES